MGAAAHVVPGGCILADHYDEVGQVGDLGPGPVTGFGAVEFYLSVVDDLAARGYFLRGRSRV